MIYCCSDIHGEYDRYCNMIQQLPLSKTDKLYILGDVVDRGRESIRILQDMQQRENVIPLFGNHEYLALRVLPMLSKSAAIKSPNGLGDELISDILEWQNIGGQATIDEFHKLQENEQEEIIRYISSFRLYVELNMNNQKYILLHSGPDDFMEEKKLSEYSLQNLVSGKMDYGTVYYTNSILVTGHTPTRFIEEGNGNDCIFEGNNHIALDCGCGYGGHLGVICLETREKRYF